MNGGGARKTVGLQILGDAVGRREADDASPLLLVRVADGGERKALAGAGAPSMILIPPSPVAWSNAVR